jgi:hypothetical protein
MMISSASREFLAALAGAAAALTGLLFVAMSVAPRHNADDADGNPPVIRQIRAAAALLAFVNSLAVSLFGLEPGIGIRWPAVLLGISGILFIAAGTRSILASSATGAQQRGQLGLLNLLLLIFGTEFVTGIILVVDSHLETVLDILSAALVCSLLVGIARAWELVGDRSTSVMTSIRVLTEAAPGPATNANRAGDDHGAGSKPE